jgi:hypothetical protein
MKQESKTRDSCKVYFKKVHIDYFMNSLSEPVISNNSSADIAFSNFAWVNVARASNTD